MLILSDFEITQVIDLAQPRVVFERFDISELKHGF
jgi:hypothetical protein